jgi:hypothetical protein
MSDVKPKRGPRDSTASANPPAAAPSASAPPIAPPEAAAAPVPQSPPPVPAPLATSSAALPSDSWTALADAQAALARGFEAFAVEATALGRAGAAAASDAALALLGAKTLAEAVEINAILARREVDALVAGGARLSEIGVTAWSEASRPLLSQLGAVWRAPLG